jgi:hypothetical protein
MSGTSPSSLGFHLVNMDPLSIANSANFSPSNVQQLNVEIASKTSMCLDPGKNAKYSIGDFEVTCHLRGLEWVGISSRPELIATRWDRKHACCTSTMGNPAARPTENGKGFDREISSAMCSHMDMSKNNGRKDEHD